MTKDLESGAPDLSKPLECVAALLRALGDIADAGEQFQAAKVSREAVEEGIRALLQQRARRMREEGVTWRGIGEAMGGVSAQRAEQISRGV
jgi:hypothetical protein